MIMVLSLKRRRSINQANQLCYEYLKCDIKECVEQTKEQPTIDSNRYLSLILALRSIIVFPQNYTNQVLEQWI